MLSNRLACAYEQAAALSFGGTTALDFLKTKGNIQRGEKLLIIGASGTVGSAAVQLAKHFGAEVTGVCGTANLPLVTSIGADKVIDYSKEDFTRNGETYDLILVAAGTTASFARCKGSLKKNGRLLMVLCGLPDLAQIPWAALTSSIKVFGGPAAENKQDFLAIKESAESGVQARDQPALPVRPDCRGACLCRHRAQEGKRGRNCRTCAAVRAAAVSRAARSG